jgi:hypothetical protein
VFSVSGTISGTFAQILPEEPGAGLAWDTTELYTKGILRVMGGTTGIDARPVAGGGVESEYFTLTGGRVSGAVKGLYLHRSVGEDGKPVVRKVISNRK